MKIFHLRGENPVIETWRNEHQYVVEFLQGFKTSYIIVWAHDEDEAEERAKLMLPNNSGFIVEDRLQYFELELR